MGRHHAPNHEGRHLHSRSKVLVVTKDQGPLRRGPRHHEPKASPPRKPEPPVQVQATALVAKGQQPVEAMFKDVMIASQSDLESQIEALLPGSDPDVHVEDGLTLFTQYVYFRLQYWYNKYPHRWPIANHERLQSVQARRSFTGQWMQNFSSLKEPEIDRCVRFLLSRFKQAELPARSIGRKEFFTLVHALLQSKLTFEDHIGEATYYASREKNVAVLQFELQHTPGPPVQPHNWYTWSHGTDYSALAECCRPMQKYRDRQKALSLFTAKPSTNLPGLRGWQSGWLLCTTLPRTAADAWLEAYWPQATSKAPALLQAMKAITYPQRKQ